MSADVAKLALGVLRALLDGLRLGFFVLLAGEVSLGAASALYLLAEVLMAFFPVSYLAGRPAVARLAAATLLGHRGERRGAAGARRQELHHLGSVALNVERAHHATSHGAVHVVTNRFVATRYPSPPHDWLGPEERPEPVVFIGSAA